MKKSGLRESCTALAGRQHKGKVIKLSKMTNEEITKYIFIEDQDLAGDIAFVFGTWKAWKGSVEKAYELYKNKLVLKIIVSGGFNKETGIVEADFMTENLVNLGVPRKNILVENKSTNTLENVLFSKRLIDRKLGLDKIKTITAVVKNFHARRALMTLRKNMPARIILKSAPHVSPFFNFTKDDWFKTDFGREKVLGEVEKIKKYLAIGSLAEL